VLDSVQHDRATSLNVYVYVEGHVEIQKYMLADIVHVSLSICQCYPDFALPTTSLALTVITTIGKGLYEGYLWTSYANQLASEIFL
jgi:hypothetical protein